MPLTGSCQRTKVVIEDLEDVDTLNFGPPKCLLGWHEKPVKDNVIDDASDSSDASDYTYTYEAEKEAEEVEVDMRDFHNYVDKGEEFVGGNDIVEVQDESGIVTDSDDEYVSDGSIQSLTDESSDDFETRRKKGLRMHRKKMKKQLAENDKSGIGFHVGQTFGDPADLKELIKRHAVETKRDLYFLKNDRERVKVICNGGDQFVEATGSSKTECGPGQTVSGSGQSVSGQKSVGDGDHSGTKKKKYFKKEHTSTCPWLLYASKGDEGTWMIKTYKPTHTCTKTRTPKACIAGYMAKEKWVLSQVECNPNLSIKSIQEHLQTNLGVAVSRQKAFRTKQQAIEQVRGDYKDQYRSLRDYFLEVRKGNPGSTLLIQVEAEGNPESSTRVFKRVYVCLKAMKDGFKACQRELLGLDGAFMKGPYPGQLLTAVGVDPNNCIYPLAYAIVEAENKDSWIWFLQCIQHDLELPSNCNFTFISDRQKGIIPALSHVFPAAEHRFCLRHIHQNMKATWGGKLFKDKLFNCATATTVMKFQHYMEDLKKFNEECYKWLVAIPPQHWARSHFTGRAKNDMLLNNLCEVFNAKLVEGRDKPIISALEYIREYLMRRVAKNILMIEKSHGLLTPTATKMFNQIKKEAQDYTVEWNGDLYEVTGPYQNKRVVNARDKTSSCIKWELTGMPCKHAVAVIWNMKQFRLTSTTPENWVDPCYHLETWKNVYSFKVGALNGKDLWPQDETPTMLNPPIYHIPIGRPKKKRRKSALEVDEEMEKGGKLSKRLKTVKCGKCHKLGHNQRSCKGQVDVGSGGNKVVQVRKKAVGVGKKAVKSKVKNTTT
ncbi:hypothetical protein SSX86_011731 [Deinandra increscens subsp. villosa]|uniref:SWIM-type domain-containing protein n=1 Tax=Deinandra increscens subsp. villosa TaxID=3103831 RepID=A0AAP0H2J7_9ASTR